MRRAEVQPSFRCWRTATSRPKASRSTCSGTGPAALAVTTGAPLVTTVIYYERLRGAQRRAAGSPWGIVIQFNKAIEMPADLPRADRVRALTQAWVDEFAAGVRQRPQDWHMLQKVFVEDLDPERYAATVAAQAAAG